MSNSQLRQQSSENPQISVLQNPNPNCETPENDPDRKSESKTLEIKNSPPSNFEETPKTPDVKTNPDEQNSNHLVDVVGDQEQELGQQKQQNDDDDDLGKLDQEEEEIEDEEGINMAPSPLPQSLNAKSRKASVSTSRRNKKGKKGNGKKITNVVRKRKFQTLYESFKPIPFVPLKNVDFSRYEGNLRNLGLWEFAHVEFDSKVRVDLVAQLVFDYRSKERYSYVNGLRVKVNRADLARALKLPVKKPTGVWEGEDFSREFISFLEEFVSSWMLLQEGDVWLTPTEIVNWLNLIKGGQPQKVDWAGMIWFMAEKELAQGVNLEDCYYASHFQQLIKDQRGHLLMESENLSVEKPKVEEVNVEDDEEDGDTKMLDALESSLGEERLQDNKCVVEVETVSAFDVTEKECLSYTAQKDGDADMPLKDGDADMPLKDGDADMQLKDGDAGMPLKDGDADMPPKDGDADTVEMTDVILPKMDGEANKLKKVDIDEENENDVCSIGCPDETEMENIDNVEFAENVENAKEMGTDDMVEFGLERDWLMDGLNDGGQHMMQRCSSGQRSPKMSTEDTRHDGVGEDVEDELGEEGGQGFNFMGKSPMDVMTSSNLMQAVETGHLSFTSAELGGQSSLGLMPSRDENNLMLNGSSMFNQAGKRELDHEHALSHHALEDKYKRMRTDEHWDHKPPNTETCMDELVQWVGKAKIALETEKYQQESMMHFYVQQLEEKEAEVIQWKIKCEELQRKIYTEVNRRDRELHLMSSVIDGYRRALKDTQRAFAEYRKLCHIPDDPIYKDVGTGGVVKSIMELEREQAKQEDEWKRTECMLLKEFDIQINNYESQWEDLHSKVVSLDERLTYASAAVEQLKDGFLKRKMSENVAMLEEVQSEAQCAVKVDSVEHTVSENIVMADERQSEAQCVVKVDSVEHKLSENSAMADEGQSEAQEVVADYSVELKLLDDVVPEEVQTEAEGHSKAQGS